MKRRWSVRATGAAALAALLPGAALSAPAADLGKPTALSTAPGLPPAAIAVAAPSVAATDIAPAGYDVPLAGAVAGDAARGRAIVANRQLGLCLLCHTGPIPEERFQGNLAPDLQGAGARWSAAQLRARMVDASRFNPSTIMPSYYKTEGLNRVAAGYQGKTILNAQQIEDVVAWLQSLKDPAS